VREAGLEVVGVGDVLPSARPELLEVVAEDVAEPLVDTQPAPLWADVGDADDRPFERRPKESLATE